MVTKLADKTGDPHACYSELEDCNRNHCNLADNPLPPTSMHLDKSVKSAAHVLTKRVNFCTDKLNGLHADSTDCGNYINNLNGDESVENCPAGLYLDPETLVYNYPEEVICNNVG
ncbi:hypothetical protein IMSHALPRED_001578 [Imshaugia aleurites]|uniref:Chitin-binding type-2 domain-containing protein n=1 Tax=Imshaugia aleurites TaxID=172621 RepID=A0A8H3PG54_9LECA|nr:hypothetical protein IMSHALPRED_001578 [Imshaugia aleurites]